MKYLCCIFMMYSANVLAVPFVFTPGGKAEASQVNANFADIDSKIALGNELPKKNKEAMGLLSQRVILVEAKVPACVQSDVTRITLNYVQKIGPLGKTFTIGMSNYTLRKAPFKDIESGTKYAITFPFAEFSVRGLKTVWKDTSQYCWNTTIAGYPARTAAFKFEREMTFVSQTNVNIATAIMVVSFDIEILVGLTVVSFEVSGAASELSANYLVNVPYNYTGTQQYTNMVKHQDIITAIDDMIDYISIEKLP